MSTAENETLAHEIADMISDRLPEITLDAELLSEPAPGAYWDTTTAERVTDGAWAVHLVERPNRAISRDEGTRKLTIVVSEVPS